MVAILPGCSVLLVVVVDDETGWPASSDGSILRTRGNGENTGYDSSELIVGGIMSETGGELNDKRVGSKYASSE